MRRSDGNEKPTEMRGENTEGTVIMELEQSEAPQAPGGLGGARGPREVRDAMSSDSIWLSLTRKGECCPEAITKDIRLHAW